MNLGISFDEHECSYYCRDNIHTIRGLLLPFASKAMVRGEIHRLSKGTLKFIDMKPAYEENFEEDARSNPENWSSEVQPNTEYRPYLIFVEQVK